MKGYANITVALTIVFVIAGCSGKEKHAAKDVAYRYAMDMANYRIDSAAQYATAETMETLEIGRRLVSAVGQEYIDSDTPANIEITAVELENDTMAFAVYHKTTPIKDFIDTLHLRKRNGKWLAHCPRIAHERPKNAMSIDTNENKIKRFHYPAKELTNKDSLK